MALIPYLLSSKKKFEKKAYQLGRISGFSTVFNRMFSKKSKIGQKSRKFFKKNRKSEKKIMV